MLSTEATVSGDEVSANDTHFQRIAFLAAESTSSSAGEASAQVDLGPPGRHFLIVTLVATVHFVQKKRNRQTSALATTYTCWARRAAARHR